jgi:FlaA1/EpsC-like NDP-sugar epimerase
VDYVVHAAATKIVPTAEYNPFECIKTNVNGAMNLIDACIDKKVKGVVALSTDKASSPINLYGATKLTSDKLFVAGNAYSGEHGSKFSVVRYGNVMGSRGSVIPFFMSIRDKGVLPITDDRMTRFMISLEQGVELVWHAFEDMVGGEIYVKKIPSMKVTDLARVVAPECKQEVVGIRPGEKLHEQMIGSEDSYYTFEYPEHFKILPTINDDGYVSVQLLQEVSSLTPQTVSAALSAPIISTREASTRAVLRDGQTVVIAGLIGDTRQVQDQGIPLLMDIPYLGGLFRRQSTTPQRTELAIFVTPYIVRSDTDADAIRERIRKRMEEKSPGALNDTPVKRPPSR